MVSTDQDAEPALNVEASSTAWRRIFAQLIWSEIVLMQRFAIEPLI